MKTIIPFTTDYICREQLDCVKMNMKPEELKAMEKAIDDIIGTTLGFSSYEARLLARNMFELGYLAAHTELIK